VTSDTSKTVPADEPISSHEVSGAEGGHRSPLSHAATHSEGRSRLRSWWQRSGAKAFDKAMRDNISLIAQALAVGLPRTQVRVLDLGCWDGTAASEYLPRHVGRFGIEISPLAAHDAARRSFQVIRGDLNGIVPLRSASFDAVTSNQVIEHLNDTDVFLAETYRVLKPGGLLVISTENLASWHNIFALLLGWQAFSLSNVSEKVAGIGNPLANLRGEMPVEKGWQHLRVFSYRGLADLVAAHGYTNVRVVGSGYYPLPSKFAALDPRHAAFIVAIARRPAGTDQTGRRWFGGGHQRTGRTPSAMLSDDG
jgi:SAM-dependent methyltransferase